MTYSGYAAQTDADRSAVLSQIAPVSDPIASTSSTELKLSGETNPHIAWVYWKVDALTHYIEETKITFPQIAGNPLVSNYGDIQSSATHPNWNHEPTFDWRNAPANFIQQSGTALGPSDAIEFFAKDLDVGGEASRIACVIGVTDGTPLVSSNTSPYRVDYVHRITGFAANAADSWSNQSLSDLTQDALPDVPVSIVAARLDSADGVAFRFVYPKGSIHRPIYLATNSVTDMLPNINQTTQMRPFLAVSEIPSVDILSFGNDTPSALTLFLQRV